MEKQGIIVKETQPKEWINSLVAVQRPGKLRVCVDPRNLNRAMKRLAWNSSDCFESFSPLNNVWIDRPLMSSSDVTHYPKTG